MIRCTIVVIEEKCKTWSPLSPILSLVFHWLSFQDTPTTTEPLRSSVLQSRTMTGTEPTTTATTATRTSFQGTNIIRVVVIKCPQEEAYSDANNVNDNNSNIPNKEPKIDSSCMKCVMNGVQPPKAEKVLGADHQPRSVTDSYRGCHSIVERSRWILKGCYPKRLSQKSA